MINIGLLFFGSLNAPTGASTVLRNIANGFQEDENYNLKIYSLDSSGDIDKKDNKVAIKNKTIFFKKNLHRFLNFGAKYSIYIAYSGSQ